MATSFNIARNDLSRAFIFENGIHKCCIKPNYVPCLSIDSLAQDVGDITRIECPDPNEYGKFIEVGNFPGEISRLTTTLTARMSRTQRSFFYRLFRGQCSFDLHVHFGLCERPNMFNVYDKALVFEDVQVTSFGTDPLSALTSGDRAEINETIDISIGNFYEIVPLLYSEVGQAQTALTNALIDGTNTSRVKCGSFCNDADDGCDNNFVVDAVGNVLFSNDAATSWDATTAIIPNGSITGIDDLGSMLWLYDDGGSIWFTSTSDVLSGTTAWIEDTSVSANGAAMDSDSYAVVAGDSGLIGVFDVLGQGWDDIHSTITTENLVSVNVHETCTLIGGENGTLIYSLDGETFNPAPSSPTANTITTVLPLSDLHWYVSDGTNLWCSDDCGQTWSQVTLPSNIGTINDIDSETSHIVWLSTDSGLWKSIDGGCTYTLQPETKQAFPNTNGVNKAVICKSDPNWILAVGEDDGGAGLLVRGLPKG